LGSSGEIRWGDFIKAKGGKDIVRKSWSNCGNGFEPVKANKGTRNLETRFLNGLGYLLSILPVKMPNEKTVEYAALDFPL